jgi:hypothetical protein
MAATLVACINHHEGAGRTSLRNLVFVADILRSKFCLTTWMNNDTFSTKNEPKEL